MKPKLKWAIFLEGRNISKACWDFNQEGTRWDLLSETFVADGKQAPSILYLPTNL